MLPLSAVVLWGGNAVVTKLSAGLIDPVSITFYRWLLAALLLAPFAVTPLKRQPTELIRHLPKLVVLGLLGCALFPFLMYLAARDTSAINIGIIQALMPLLALSLSRMISRTVFGAATALGMVLSLSGVILVVSQGRPAALLSHALNKGDLVMLGATACFALYSVLLGRWRSGMPQHAELCIQATVAALALLPAFVQVPRQVFTPAALPLIGYAAALASIAAPLLWIKGIVRIGAARATTYFNLLPLITAALAVALLGEPLNAGLVLGGLLVVAGVVVAERTAKR